MSNGIGAPLPGFDAQVIPGRCKLYLMLAIACFGLLLVEAYVIGQPINDFDVKGEMAKIRGGKYTKMPSPDKKSIDDHQTVTYEVKNDTKRELLFLFEGPSEGALVVKPGSSESTDVLPGVYEIAVREREEEGSILKPQYERLESVRGTEYTFTYSSDKIEPCSIIAGQYRIVQGQAVTFRGIVAPRVFNKDEMEQVEYKFFFDDKPERDWSKEAEAEHVYSRPGTYEAALEVRSGDKKYASRKVIITVDRKPLAVSLRAEPVNPVTGQVAAFRAIPEGDTEDVEYKFDFGDGKVREWSGKTTAKHAYSSPGRYTPYVIARIGEEELQRGEIIINVRRRPPIEVHLTVKPVRAKTGENVDFSAVQEARIEGTEFRFDFGDGEVSGWSTATTAKHAYAREREYIASVKARLGDRAADSDPVIIQVVAGDKQVVADDEQVMADYKVVIYAKAQRTREGDEIIYREGDRTKFKQGDEIVFGAVLTPGAHGALFEFDFGDDSSTDSTLEPEVKHKYTSPGKYISYVTASIRGTKFQSGILVINVEARRPSLLPLLLLLAPAAGYYLLRKIKPKPSLQLKPGGDPGIQRVNSDTSLLSYPEIRLRSVLEPDRDRINIEVSLAVGEEVET